MASDEFVLAPLDFAVGVLAMSVLDCLEMMFCV